MVGGMAICGGSEDVRDGRMGIGGGGCGMSGGMLAPAISGRRNQDATEAHWKRQKQNGLKFLNTFFFFLVVGLF